MARDAAKEAIKLGIPRMDALIKGCCEGLKVVGVMGERIKKKGCESMTEKVMALEAFKAAVEVLKPSDKTGRFVIGTPVGDFHSWGKDFVIAMLEVAGFEVYDLGVDVPPEVFVEKAKELGADFVGASAALFGSTLLQKVIVNKLRSAGTKVKYVVGGASCTPEWAKEISADGYGEDLLEALKVTEELYQKLKEERKSGY